jgi:adenylate cyclase
LLWRLALANVIGATINTVVPVRARPSGRAALDISLEAFGLYMLVSVVVLVLVTRARLVRDLSWFTTGQEATDVQRRAVLRVPRLMAVVSLIGWTGGAAVFTGVFIATGATTLDTVVNLGRNVLAAAASAAVAFLLGEHVTRPVLAQAYRTVPLPPGSRLGLRSRLGMAWVIGSAVPMAAFGLAFLGRDPVSRARLSSYAWTFVVAGLLAGGVVIWGVARSFVDPLDRLRGAMAAIGAGELQTRLKVDDATEIGQLQAGLNQMAVGLEERERLRDLFGRHVGTEVAVRAVLEGAQLGGERKQATALFIDLIGSTAMAEENDPEQVVELLNEVFEVVVEAVVTAGGWVNKFEGDAALCVFGPPAGDRDHADRALSAAVAIRSGLQELRRKYPQLDGALGVCSGWVVAGNIGHEQRFEYTIIGDPVNQAARLTELAKRRPGRALAAASTLELAGANTTSWLPAGSVVLRGRSEPTELYELEVPVAVEIAVETAVEVEVERRS